MGVSTTQRVWHVLSVCGMSLVGVVWLQWVWTMTQRVWHVLSGCGMAPGCDMASMGVAWLSRCGVASVAVA